MRLLSNLFARVASFRSPSTLNDLCAIANENMSGKTRAPRCSKGILSDHSPRLPPTIEGEADINKACRSLNGCGRNRETQSITFFRRPGIEPLYSGEEIMNASFAKSRFLNSIAPFGMSPFDSKSWLKEEQSNSLMFARSTFTVITLNYLGR